VQRARTGEEVYRTVGNEVAKLGYEAAILVLDEGGARLELAYLTVAPGQVAWAKGLLGLTEGAYRFPLRPGGLFDRILAGGQSVYSEQTVDYVVEALPEPIRPLAEQIARRLNLGHSILSPLRTGERVIGLLVVTGRGLSQVDIPAITAFANQASIAIENARLYEAERASRQQLRDLADYLQTVREDERTHIAREIHDELGQALTALKIDVSWLARRLPPEAPNLVQKAAGMSGLIDQTIQMVRRIATELRPGLLDDLGLVAALEWQAQDFSQRTGIESRLDLGPDDLRLDRDLATTIFRIYQEALTNVARHAGASQVQISLRSEADHLVLVVEDNGRGMAPDQMSAPHSLGLMGMRERARAWGGDVFFEGGPGRGTTVRVCLPHC
jgi:signal transduction histidine kinase